MTKSPDDCSIADPRREVMTLLDKMRGAINNGAHQRMYQLTDQLEILVRSGMEPVIADPMPGVQLTGRESRLLGRLAQAKGGCVTKQQIMDALYFDCVNDEPDIKIVDVFICKTRSKMKRRNAPYAIQTVFGRGYALKELAA